MKLGWIGIGRMGYEMAARLAKGGADVTVWNRTRAKADPLAQFGAKIAGKLADLAACDIVFVMVSAYDDVNDVIAGPAGLLSGGKTPKIVVECSSISLDGSSALPRCSPPAARDAGGACVRQREGSRQAGFVRLLGPRRRSRGGPYPLMGPRGGLRPAR
jgi:3-hydroxyisobutyrate dehydrogenase